MKKQILLILSLILGTTTFSFAQATRTVTNNDLEKFRQKREQAEAEYRATYKERGLPSPEEIEQREAERQKDLADYAARARASQQREDEIRAQSNEFIMQNNYPGAEKGSYYGQRPLYQGGQVSVPFLYNGYGGYYNGYYGSRYRRNRRIYPNIPPHTQLSPLLPNVQINRNPTLIFTTPTNFPRRIYASPIGGSRGGRIH